MTQQDLLIERVAKRHDLPVSLVSAIVRVESGGDPWAIRYEPQFYDHYIAPKPVKGKAPCSAQTEGRMQATSWGLMQIMGATARETGFNGVFLSQLCDPETGLDWGCRYLIRLFKRFGGQGDEAVIAAYNAGSPRKTGTGAFVNQAYVDKIRSQGWA